VVSAEPEVSVERLISAVLTLTGKLATAQREIDLAEQREINDVLAARLGGVLAKVEPAAPRRGARPKLVVDNSDPQPGGER
jgi:hypothetical protein